MGSVSSKRIPLQKKEEAFALRLSGCSYREIQEQLGIASRGTLSYWFRELVLSPQAQKRLERNTEKASRVGFTKFNADRTQKIKDADALVFKAGLDSIGELTSRDLLLVGATLYWGEGTKSGGVKNTPRVVFTNSNPDMIRVFLKFARHSLSVPLERISGELHLYEGIHPDEAKKYWSLITDIPVERFWYTTQVSGASQHKRPASRLPYGTMAVRIPGRLYFSKIMGLIEGIQLSS